MMSGRSMEGASSPSLGLPRQSTRRSGLSGVNAQSMRRRTKPGPTAVESQVGTRTRIQPLPASGSPGNSRPWTARTPSSAGCSSGYWTWKPLVVRDDVQDFFRSIRCVHPPDEEAAFPVEHTSSLATHAHPRCLLSSRIGCPRRAIPTHETKVQLESHARQPAQLRPSFHR